MSVPTPTFPLSCWDTELDYSVGRGHSLNDVSLFFFHFFWGKGSWRWEAVSTHWSNLFYLVEIVHLSLLALKKNHQIPADTELSSYSKTVSVNLGISVLLTSIKMETNKASRKSTPIWPLSKFTGVYNTQGGRTSEARGQARTGLCNASLWREELVQILVSYQSFKGKAESLIPSS